MALEGSSRSRSARRERRSGERAGDDEPGPLQLAREAVRLVQQAIGRGEEAIIVVMAEHLHPPGRDRDRDEDLGERRRLPRLGEHLVVGGDHLLVRIGAHGLFEPGAVLLDAGRREPLRPRDANDRLAVPAELRECLSPRRDPVVLLGRLGDEETLAVHARAPRSPCRRRGPGRAQREGRGDRGQPVDQSRRARCRQARAARQRCSPDHRSDRAAADHRPRPRRRRPKESAGAISSTASSPPSVRGSSRAPPLRCRPGREQRAAPGRNASPQS